MSVKRKGKTFIHWEKEKDPQMDSRPVVPWEQIDTPHVLLENGP
jgi:hypothetical protein